MRKALSLRLPESLHRQIRELARRDGISVTQFTTTALAEKMALMTSEHLEERAARGTRDQFVAALDKVNKNTEPDPKDRM